MQSNSPDPRAALCLLLGWDVPSGAFTKADTQDVLEIDGWLLEDILFETASGEKIPALFHRPATGAAPAVLYCHAHGNRYEMGRDELVKGRSSLQGPFGPALKDIGVASLCLDMPCFGGRQHKSESELSKALLWRGKTLFGQMLSELSNAVSFLTEHPSIDAARIGALGFSMGSTHAWWMAALDQRIRAASALCSFADLDRLIETGAHDKHGIYMTVPGLTAQYRSGQIAALAAPRALQIGVGLQDWSTPKDVFEVGKRDLDNGYDAAGVPAMLEYFIDPELDHRESPEMRNAVLEFFTRRLCS